MYYRHPVNSEVALAIQSMMDSFESRYVAFLDVLGWRRVMEDAARDAELAGTIVRAIREINRVTTERLQHELGGLGSVRNVLGAQLSQFSDSIVLSSKPGSFGMNLFGFLLEVLGVVRSFLFHGLLVRGGIAFGSVVHEGSLAMGPALNHAYEIEAKVAIFPRVVLWDNWQAHQLPWDPLIHTAANANDDGLAKFHLLRRDADGQVFLDYLFPLVHPLAPADERLADRTDMFLRPARAVLLKHMPQWIDDPHIGPKYVWLNTYYNDVCRETGLLETHGLWWKRERHEQQE